MKEAPIQPHREHQIRTGKEKLPQAAPLSEELVTTSLEVAYAVEQGSPVTAAQAEKLADATVKEFTKDAPPLTDKQQKVFEKEVKKAYQREEKSLEDVQPVPKVDIKEYQETFDYIYKLYGLNKHAGSIAFLESIMLTRAAMTEMAAPLLMKQVPKMIEDSTGRGEQLFRMAKQIDRMSQDQKVTYLKSAGKFTLPIWGPVAGVLSSIALDGLARKAYEKQTMFMREAINDRVASSIFMRDFEFIQDKSPAEILNIIDKGKQATMELINTTYTEVMPTIASIVAASGSGFSMNKLGGLLGIVRLPILYATNKKQLESILGERQRELHQKDAVDTRIMTSLQSIEVVKASDTMENAINELNTTIQQRDTLAIESRKRLVKRGQTEKYLDQLFEFIIPAGLGALEYNKRRDKSSAGFDTMAGVAGYMTFNNIQLGQGSTGRHATELVRIFSDKIQPALQDIRRMEELLGPYDLLDKPDGIMERSRKSVDELANFDITVQNLNFKNILHDVSLDIPQGSFITIKGPSGIGKTTFLRHLIGFYGAEKGAMQYGGHDLNSIKKFGEKSIYSKLAYANQNPQYFENMTLRENLLMWTKKQVKDQKLTDVLHDLRLDHIADRLDSQVKHFSGGELRRIGIARALLKDPKVLFLDEPTANLDEASSKQVLQIIKDMRRNRPDMTVVAVTHDPNFEAIAERIVDFAEVNKPSDTSAASLGNRQVFYAAAKSDA